MQVREEALISIFSHDDLQPGLTGAVEAVRIVRDPKTNIGKGIAYVLFNTKAAARAALQLDGHKLDKRSMRVSRVDNRASSGSSAAAAQAGKLGLKGSKGKRQKGYKARVSGVIGKDGKPLGIKQGGVQKRGGASAAAADWQGLRTKGKGAGVRGSKPAGQVSWKPGEKQGGGPDRAKQQGRGSAVSKGKRPAVAARKAAAKAAARPVAAK
eukprot:GHRR01016205.1.p1 GENE.GHRR01016205.1~~GHRR01016205.1.p1  ORF type:complete len:211 (+),score=80.94 GHRR01016205.1:818-1450(+)